MNAIIVTPTVNCYRGTVQTEYRIMPMTHVTEIDAENPYQKTPSKTDTKTEHVLFVTTN